MLTYKTIQEFIIHDSSYQIFISSDLLLAGRIGHAIRELLKNLVKTASKAAATPQGQVAGKTIKDTLIQKSTEAMLKRIEKKAKERSESKKK